MSNEDVSRPSQLPGPRVSTSWYRWDGSRSPSVAVVEAVADATDRVQTELPPIQSEIETDALDVLLRSDGNSTVEISFVYDGVPVKIDQDGIIEVGPTETDGV